MIPYIKSPAEVRSYTYNWADVLDTAAIVTSVWSAQTGITIVGSSNTAGSASVTVSGGTENETYLLTNTITANNGQTYEAAILVRIIPIDRDSVLRRARLRADIGDTGGAGAIPGVSVAFTDSELDDLWIRAKSEYPSDEVAYAYMRILALDQLLGSATRQHSYAAGSQSENLSEIFQNIGILRNQYWQEWQRIKTQNYVPVRWGTLRYKKGAIDLPDGS